MHVGTSFLLPSSHFSTFTRSVQASLSQMSALSTGGGVNMLQEMAGLLRRCGLRD